jgi:hypothetical protein
MVTTRSGARSGDDEHVDSSSASPVDNPNPEQIAPDLGQPSVRANPLFEADDLDRITQIVATFLASRAGQFPPKFRNTVMNIAHNELGIAHEYVPRNCHQSNELIERLNRTIASTMRAVLTQTHILPAMWGEAALYAVHVYNLTPRSALHDRKESSAVPHSLFMKDSPERMARLYHQLIPFGILCNIVQTVDKPKQVKKLDPRSVPGIIVSMRPSTHQYRVKVVSDSGPYRVHIVRHVVINAAHYTEYFARKSVLPFLKRCHSVHWVSVLNFEQGVSLTSAHVNSKEVLCCTLLAAQALSRAQHNHSPGE